MSCYSPMLIKKEYSSSGKKDFKFLGKASTEDLAMCYSSKKKDRLWFDNNFIIVPCGNCIGCRLDYSSTWADRMVLESLDKPCVFLTLTYNDENFVYNQFDLPITFSDHVTKFIQDLRNRFRDLRIKYCSTSEYGLENLRPHYHFILFNLDLTDLDVYFYKLNEMGSPMFNSRVIDDLWTFGFSVVEEANYYNMAYTARYILKKQKGQGSSEYAAYDIPPEKFRCSNRPGIAHDWIVENYYDLYTKGSVSFDRNILPFGKVLPNRYFDKYVKELDPDLYYHNKSKRHMDSLDFFHQKLENSSMTFDNILSYYEFEKNNFLKKNSLNS